MKLVVNFDLPYELPQGPRGPKVAVRRVPRGSGAQWACRAFCLYAGSRGLHAPPALSPHHAHRLPPLSP
jgi:hypothetical protein